MKLIAVLKCDGAGSVQDISDGGEVGGDDALAGAFAVQEGREKFPTLILGNQPSGLVAAHLLVERVEQLLAGGRAGVGGAVVAGAAEAAPPVSWGRESPAALQRVNRAASRRDKRCSSGMLAGMRLSMQCLSERASNGDERRSRPL